MEWFKLNLARHIGLMRSRTMAEEGCYMRMLTAMYTHLGPLPPDLGQVSRLIGAKKRLEREVAGRILSECFECREDGWYDPNAEVQIDNFLKKREEGRLRQARKAEIGVGAH